MHGESAEEEQIIIDSTVQESNLTFPTDGKLALKIIIHLLRIAKKESIKLSAYFTLFFHPFHSQPSTFLSSKQASEIVA